ncbi:MAG: PEPxxWA-CTERM sorting domain-containing protein [Proteobacteria bacterium]|nr:PEPxxWA-CTERM sorting domain-containing protein [Pseudomonadota bacterium]
MKYSFRINSAASLAGLTLAGAVFGFPLAASANQVVILPNSQWSGFVSVPSSAFVLTTTQVTGPSTIQGGVGNSFAGETTQGTPFPSIDVSAGGFDSAQISGGKAHVSLTYFIEIVGPGSGPAPLHVTGAGSVGSYNGGIGAVSLEVVTPGIEFLSAVTSINGVATVYGTDGVQPLVPDNTAFNIDGTMLFPINTILSVIMFAEADSDLELGPSQGAAFIDPIFSIDPSFANADQYSIVTSPDIGNGGAGGGVPEPSTWALLLGGFGALGAVLRGRRKAAFLAQA